jgi:hypothetical protein
LPLLDWFGQFILLAFHDIFRRVFSIFKPEQLEQAIICWTERLKNKMKTHRLVRWKSSQGSAMINNYIFSMLGKANIFLGQLTIGEKTNNSSASAFRKI